MLARSRLALALVGGVLIAMLAAAPAALGWVRVVTKRNVSYPHYTSIQAAVDAA